MVVASDLANFDSLLCKGSPAEQFVVSFAQANDSSGTPVIGTNQIDSSFVGLDGVSGQRFPVDFCGGPGCSDRFFGFLSGIIARRNRGGGNVKISFIDFQGLWEGRETALSFSALSIDRHFHGRLRCALCRPC